MIQVVCILKLLGADLIGLIKLALEIINDTVRKTWPQGTITG